jgi:hypothetical protein
MPKNIEESKQALSRDGCCILRNLIPLELIDDLKSSIKEQCYYLAKINNIIIDNNSSLDEIYNTICLHDRNLGSIIFENVMNLPEFLALVSCKSIRNVAKNFLDSRVLFSPPHTNTFRIDKSGEVEHLLNWHQDYTYEFLSDPSLTFWVPIFEVTEKLGPPIIIIGSHKDLKETEFTLQKNMHGKVKIIPKISQEVLNLNDSEVVTGTYSPGDVLVMNTKVVHKSGKNESLLQNRWTAQIRIGAFDNSDFANRNWTYETSGAFELFKKLYPKLTKHTQK